MAAHNAHAATTPTPFVVSTRTKTIYSVGLFVGVLAFALAVLKGNDHGARAWHSFLTSAFFFMNIALGGLFFAAFNNVANAGWSATIRRIAEAFTAYLPAAMVTFLVIGILGATALYPWLNPKIASTDQLVIAKKAYLNYPFYLVRIVAFFGLWLLFKKLIVGNSLKQDETGDPKFTLKNASLSVAFILVFALSYSLFSVDSMMSLEPHFFSTIWGVYCFAGMLQSFFATMILFCLYIIKKGFSRGMINEEHVHDLAKYMMAFTVFWAYIAFSQFMLIWYANLPEETFFYLDRTHGGWMMATAALFIFKFAVPFLLLLPRWAKRTPAHLVAVSLLILVMQYVDIHWMVYPNLNQEKWILGWQEIGIFAGFAGLFIWAVTRFLSRHNIVAIKDPRLHEAMSHHVVY